MTTASSGPLDGVRVLELGNFIAGPFAGQLLGDYGADVIKVESPGDGDPMRRWGVTRDGDSLWWPSIGRNKRSIVLDLRQEPARQVAARLAEQCDVVLENFRPGQLDKWGLSYDELAARNPKVVLVHVSGFGQTGPLAAQAGFGSVGEAMGGIRYTTGSPDRPPSRAGISLGDALASVFAVIGTLAALVRARDTGKGQEVDVAIYEAVAALMESTMADFELGGVTRTRSGSVLPGRRPVERVPDRRRRRGRGRRQRRQRVRAGCARRWAGPSWPPTRASRPTRAAARTWPSSTTLVGAWTATAPCDEILATLDAHGVPAGRIFTAPDMLTDPQYLARDMVRRLTSTRVGRCR